MSCSVYSLCVFRVFCCGWFQPVCFYESVCENAPKVDRRLQILQPIFRVEYFRQQVCRSNVDWHSNDSSLADFWWVFFLANYTHTPTCIVYLYNPQHGRNSNAHKRDVWIIQIANVFRKLILSHNFGARKKLCSAIYVACVSRVIKAALITAHQSDFVGY